MIRQQAEDYVSGRLRHGLGLSASMERDPLMVVDFDLMTMVANWQEAPEFIAHVVDTMTVTAGIQAITVGSYLEESNENQAVWPGPVIDASPADQYADWRLPRLYAAARQFQAVAHQRAESDTQRRRLTQALRELFMAYSLPSTGPMVPELNRDQIERMRDHINSAMTLVEDLSASQRTDDVFLSQREAETPIFSQLDTITLLQP